MIKAVGFWLLAFGLFRFIIKVKASLQFGGVFVFCEKDIYFAIKNIMIPTNNPEAILDKILIPHVLSFSFFFFLSNSSNDGIIVSTFLSILINMEIWSKYAENV